MTDLTKRETLYFIITAILSLTVLVATLWMWSQTQNNCWQGKSEQIAIRECEG